MSSRTKQNASRGARERKSVRSGKVRNARTSLASMPRRAAANVKWLYPGMRVKRWLVLATLGVCIALLGMALLSPLRSLDLLAFPNHFWGWLGKTTHLGLFSTQATHLAVCSGALLVLFGMGLFFFACSRLMHSVTSALLPGDNLDLVDKVYKNRFLAQGARVVVIGGGTGLSTMLRGLKQYTSNITAIVTVADDGGSSGKLQKQLNILPPGDIRNCLVALADAEAAMTELFQYRFKAGGTGEGLKDHAFGNLFIAALSEISHGDFLQALRQASRVLNIRGRVLPATLTHVCLLGEMEDGSILAGETTIAHSPLKIKRIRLSPEEAAPLPEALEAIETADVIVIGPGSVYTSIVPNLLVRGIPEALQASKAKKVYICNVMTQPGETDGFCVSDHVRVIEAHAQRPIFNYVLHNTAMPSPELLDKYRQTGAVLVEPDADRVRGMGYRPISGNFISQTDVVRHDPALLSEAIMRLLI